MANNKKTAPKRDGMARNKSMSAGERRVREYASGRMHQANQAFHLKLKHLLGGVSLLSLLAAFEVFSIPAGSGIIDFLGLTRISAAEVWFGVALSAGFMALILHKQES